MNMMFKKKAKSSAIIIALIVGTIMSIVMIGSSLIIGQRLQISAQSRQGKLAYRAALSGIEDGLMLVKQANALGQLDLVLDKTKTGNVLLDENINRRKAYHDLTISSGPISSFPLKYFGYTPSQLDGLMFNLGQDNAVGQLTRDDIEKFNKVNADDVVDINIPENINPADFKIYFSRPHTYNSTGSPVYFSPYYTALNVRLIDMTKPAEGQMVYEKTVSKYNDTSVAIDTAKIDLCKISGKCKLKIKPQVVKKSTSGDLSGAGAGVQSGKFIYFAIIARDSANNLIKYEDARPGVVTIQSTGYVGRAVRKIQAKVDTTTGTYLGLFDFGIYCGDKCWGRGIDEL